MSFDVNDPAHLLELKTEQADDPIGMGYAAVDTQTQQTLKLFNDPANNVGGQSADTPLSPEVLLQVLDADEYQGPPVGDSGRALFDLYIAAGLSDNSIELEQFRAAIKSIFATNGATNTAIDALQSLLSRAEFLFGQGTVISKSDWIAARDS